MSIFNIDDDIRIFLSRMKETAAAADAVLAEALMLLQELRAEVAAVKRMREALGKE